MAVLFSAPSRQYNPGPTTIVPGGAGAALPDGIRFLTIHATRDPATWPADPTVMCAQINMEFSLDGGATWPMYAGFGAYGGLLPNNRDGSPMTEMQFTSPELPLVSNRRVRFTVQVLETITTAITIEG